MTESEELISSDDRALIWPALLVFSLFLPWVSVAGFLSIQLTAFDMDIGPVILVVTLGVAASWIYQNGKYREEGWLGGGIVLGLLFILSILNIQSAIGEYRSETEGNMFADAVVVNIGIGAYIAVIASTAIIYVGYQMYTSGTVEDESSSSNTSERSDRRAVFEEISQNSGGLETSSDTSWRTLVLIGGVLVGGSLFIGVSLLVAAQLLSNLFA